MFTKKVPFYLVVISFIIPSLAFMAYVLTEKKEVNWVADTTLDTPSNNDCNLNIKRLNGYEFIRPLVFAEPSCESIDLLKYKPEIEGIINSKKAEGSIKAASVYLREFGNAQWICINEEEKYSPGSLMKIPELIAFYKMNEKMPGYLEKKVTYNQRFITDKQPVYLSKAIKFGETYTIRELLKYMIVYSDNNATILLNSIIDRTVFKRVFSDIGLPEPDFTAKEYPISANDFSIFMKELFNASYLDKSDSEACLELLSKSDFKDGLISGLPGSCATAHKFGEGGQLDAPNFSESAIVYCGKKPYLLTVMTKGRDMKKLPLVISEISRRIYSLMTNS